MSTDQQKIIREAKRRFKVKGLPLNMTKSEKKYFQQRLNYPEIYGVMPEKIVLQLYKLGVKKRKKGA